MKWEPVSWLFQRRREHVALFLHPAASVFSSSTSSYKVHSSRPDLSFLVMYFLSVVLLKMGQKVLLLLLLFCPNSPTGLLIWQNSETDGDRKACRAGRKRLRSTSWWPFVSRVFHWCLFRLFFFSLFNKHFFADLTNSLSAVRLIRSLLAEGATRVMSRRCHRGYSWSFLKGGLHSKLWVWRVRDTDSERSRQRCYLVALWEV